MAILKHNNNSISNVTSFALVPSGSPVLLATSTASGSASISFTTGIDSTYDIYKFIAINMNPITADRYFQFNISTDSGSNYNVTKTSTSFNGYHTETDAAAALSYEASTDLAQGTGEQRITAGINNSSDANSSFEMYLFAPSSSVYVKHFLITSSDVGYDGANEYEYNRYIAGYGNTTSPINAIRFSSNSATFNGTIKMYGIKGN
jgi:hypothetical protein